MKVGRYLNPKAEGRRPKKGQSSKAEATGLEARRPFVAAKLPRRISDFRHPRNEVGGPVRLGLRPTRYYTRGFMLTEALVYIGLVFLLLGLGYLAMYRCIDNSVALRSNADDIIRAMHAGELWRSDIRQASRGVRWDNSGEPLLVVECSSNRVDYRFAEGVLYRRTNAGPWSRFLDRVESCSMESERRPDVSVWRWELELQSHARGSFKPGRVRPVFTFLAVPPSAP